MSNLLIENNDGIVTVTINREKALNALNYDTFSELNQFFGHDAKQIKGLKGVIVTGAGEKAFVAGADITEFSELNAKAGRALAKRGQDIFFLIENFNRPVIAAVNGFALGGPCGHSGLDHRIFTRYLISIDRDAKFIMHAAHYIKIGHTGFHHHAVCALGNIHRHFAQSLIAIGWVHLVAFLVAFQQSADIIQILLR